MICSLFSAHVHQDGLHRRNGKLSSENSDLSGVHHEVFSKDSALELKDTVFEYLIDGTGSVQGSRGDSLETLHRVETLCVKAVRVE